MRFTETMGNLRKKIYHGIDKFQATRSQLHTVIKKNNDIITFQHKLAIKSKEGMHVLNEYVTVTDSSFDGKMSDLMNKIERIEENRVKFIDGLYNHDILPLNKLFTKWKLLQSDIREEKEDSKALKKAKADLKKKESKPWDKVSGDELEKAERKLKLSQKNLEESRKVVLAAKTSYNNQQKIIFDEIISKLESVYGDFYSDCAQIFKSSQNSIEEFLDGECNQDKSIQDKKGEKEEMNTETKIESEKVEKIFYDVESEEGIEVIYMK